PVAPEHLPSDVRAPRAADADAPRATARYAAPRDPRREAERILRVLAETGGNKSEAARALGMSRTTLWVKLQRYELTSLLPGAEAAR
ncbi:MAG TPA: helix-turn-helix domain-containing protein, partial [Longimicrobium sp.]|nr:helix-turn-helix domain-containing protein [Longimicrobium sp.]